MNFALIVNFAAFQVGWFACVLGGAHGWPWLGTLVAIVLVGAHLWRMARPGVELVLILAAALMGLVFDTLLIRLGLLQYPASGMVLQGVAPLWIIAMWMVFATTLNVALRWLKGHLVLAAVLGALGGPLAYYGGARLGGVIMLQPAASLAALALIWALAMPLLIHLSDRFDGTVEITR